MLVAELILALLFSTLVSCSVAILGRLLQPADAEDRELVELLWLRLRDVGRGEQSTP